MSQSPSVAIIRLGHTISHANFLINIRSIKIEPDANQLEEALQLTFNIVSNINANFNLQVRDVFLDRQRRRVSAIHVNTIIDNNINRVLPINLGIVENANTPYPFVYYNMNMEDLSRNVIESSFYAPLIPINIGRIEIFPLNRVIIPGCRIIQEHEDPFRARFTVEYNIVNEMDIPVRYVFIDLGSYVKGLRITDEEGNVLRFLTRQELREIFGADMIDKIKSFFVIVDLGEEQKLRDARILHFTGFDEMHKRTKKYHIGFRLVPDVTESVVIEPPPSYECKINRREDIVVGEVINNNGRYELKDAKPLQRLGSNIIVTHDLGLDAFASPDDENEIVSPAGVDLQFRPFKIDASSSVNVKPILNNQPQKTGIEIKYALEIQHKWFWDVFLTFFSIITFALIFQEFFTNFINIFTEIGFISKYSFIIFTFVFLLIFIIGSLVGFSYAVSKKLQNPIIIDERVYDCIHNFLVRMSKFFIRENKDSRYIVITLLVFIAIIIINATSVIETTVFNLYNPFFEIISKIESIYVELEFAILVVLELAYALAEKAVRDEYRDVLLTLTIITILSILLLIPWVIS